MNALMSISVDEVRVREMVLERIAQTVKQIEEEKVFWDTKTLVDKTCMSWNFIQETFFFDPDFPKFKVHSKWLFPAKETRLFLERWLLRQGGD
jgi:hypothetical protein